MARDTADAQLGMPSTFAEHAAASDRTDYGYGPGIDPRRATLIESNPERDSAVARVADFIDAFTYKGEHDDEPVSNIGRMVDGNPVYLTLTVADLRALLAAANG